jgi:uncharacterized membrane protein YdjX (TVP38/TMEM64 family)
MDCSRGNARKVLSEAAEQGRDVRRPVFSVAHVTASSLRRVGHNVSTSQWTDASQMSFAFSFLLPSSAYLHLWRGSSDCSGPAGVEEVSVLKGHEAGTAWIIVAFVLVYALIASLALPVGPLAYGAGAVFGFIRGSIAVWVASMVGATVGYLLARYVWANAARRLLGPHRKRLTGLGKANSALIAFRMQVMPIIPFGVFNYTAAISKLPLMEFLVGTAFGIIPGTLLATFVGDRFIAGVHGSDRKPLFLAIGMALALLALSFLPNLIKKMRKR